MTSAEWLELPVPGLTDPVRVRDCDPIALTRAAALLLDQGHPYARPLARLARRLRLQGARSAEDLPAGLLGDLLAI